MKEAHDHKRVSPEGKKVGAVLSKIADRGALSLARQGEPDERCKTCAFRSGTVPNGCIQTQMDALKAVTECVSFLCHAHRDSKGQLNTLCHGWVAARHVVRKSEDARGDTLNMPCPWEFSPPDDAEPQQ